MIKATFDLPACDQKSPIYIFSFHLNFTDCPLEKVDPIILARDFDYSITFLVATVHANFCHCLRLQ